MPQKRYGAYNPLYVFTAEYIQTTLEEAIRKNQERLRDWETRHNLLGCAYKTKTTQAGRMLEVEVYPSFLNRKDYTRALKQQRTGAAQKKQNDKNAQRKFVRLVHSNFAVGDIFFTGGFSDERQPADLRECHREIERFTSRLRYSSKRAGVKQILYVYVIERRTGADGAVKYHVHMILGRNAGENVHGADRRDWIESRWRGGDYANTKSLQWKRGGGFTGISKYFTKQFEQLHDTGRAGLRHWGQSLHLKPWTKKPSESYSRFKKRRVAGLLKAPATMKAEFEREFPGYGYLEEYPCEVRYSEVVDGFYLYCRMYKKE